MRLFDRCLIMLAITTTIPCFAATEITRIMTSSQEQNAQFLAKIVTSRRKLAEILSDPFKKNYRQQHGNFRLPESSGEARMEQVLLFHRQQELIDQNKNMSLLEPSDFDNDILFDDFGDQNTGLISGFFQSIHGGSLSGIVVLSIIITVVLLVVLACYLMMRFMHRALSGGEEKTHMPSEFSNVVIHSKRVYEIQAEEGVFNGTEPSEQEDETSSPEISSQEPSRSSLRRPERGDLRQIRDASGNDCDDPRQMIRKKERQVHKDSVCGFLFRPQGAPTAEMV